MTYFDMTLMPKKDYNLVKKVTILKILVEIIYVLRKRSIFDIIENASFSLNINNFSPDFENFDFFYQVIIL